MSHLLSICTGGESGQRQWPLKKNKLHLHAGDSNYICIQVYSRLVTGKFPDFPTTAAMVAKVFHFSHLLAFWRPLLDAGRQSMATKFPGLGRMKPVM